MNRFNQLAKTCNICKASVFKSTHPACIICSKVYYNNIRTKAGLVPNLRFKLKAELTALVCIRPAGRHEPLCFRQHYCCRVCIIRNNSYAAPAAKLEFCTKGLGCQKGISFVRAFLTCAESIFFPNPFNSVATGYTVANKFYTGCVCSLCSPRSLWSLSLSKGSKHPFKIQLF